MLPYRAPRAQNAWKHSGHRCRGTAPRSGLENALLPPLGSETEGTSDGVLELEYPMRLVAISQHWIVESTLCLVRPSPCLPAGGPFGVKPSTGIP